MKSNIHNFTYNELKYIFRNARLLRLKRSLELKKSLKYYENKIKNSKPQRKTELLIHLKIAKQEYTNLRDIDNYEILGRLWLESISKKFQYVAISVILISFLLSLILSTILSFSTLTIIYSVMTIFLSLFLNNYYDYYILRSYNNLIYNLINKDIIKMIKAQTISIISWTLIGTYIIALITYFYTIPSLLRSF